MTKFITVHWIEPIEGNFKGHTNIGSLNVDHIKTIITYAGSENNYCLVDGREVKESYNEVMRMIGD